MTSPRQPNSGKFYDPSAGIGIGNVPIINVNQPPSHNADPFVKGGVLMKKEFTPLGCMLICQLIQDESGKLAEGIRDTYNGILIPDTVKSWGSRIYVIVATGPDTKWVKRGDWVLVSRDVNPQVVRYKNVDTLFLHEQQCFAYIDEVRERNEHFANFLRAPLSEFEPLVEPSDV